MNLTLNREMLAVLDALESDDRCAVVVLIVFGDAFSAGMDLKEYFRETDGLLRGVQNRVREEGTNWQYRKLFNYAKPTITMVNGWCFGGAFVPLVLCDLATAAEDVTFGLSEVELGRDAGQPGDEGPRGDYPDARRDVLDHDGGELRREKASGMRLVNEAVPRDQLKERVTALAIQVTSLSQWVVRREDRLPALAADAVGSRGFSLC
ncbi:enoyl-CoA hydratase-related protein [Arthrobacter sp. NPDC080073]|uniref:enoyl-CoA hydratase-related protein n=1 Tax=Arthrobacter sp. NPDC080073 TaxID=3155919 RepID=UPI003426FF0C